LVATCVASSQAFLLSRESGWVGKHAGGATPKGEHPMQYSLQVYQYENQREFRIIDRNGEPWFVLAEVCRELGLANPRDAANRLDEDERDGVGIPDAIGREQRTTIINESGLYSLILTSRKPAAKRFKKWVTAEVLPSIRRTGAYRLPGGVPRFIRRFNDNWDRVSPGHFSVISELVIRLWGRLEQVGHIMADTAADGRELRPDVSVGKHFSKWLARFHKEVADEHSHYYHRTDEGEFPARQYPTDLLSLYHVQGPA
jgi:hypothetical protein